jgi:Group II intron, maturase-specific domain
MTYFVRYAVSLSAASALAPFADAPGGSVVGQPHSDAGGCANPYIQGWINYYGNFYRTQLRPTLQRIDIYVIRWARRKFKRLRHQPKGARDWFAQLFCANPKLFAHWQLCHGNGRTTGAV